MLSDADPEFFFTQKLEPDGIGFTNRPVTLRCAVNQAGARVKWLKDGVPISVRKLSREKKLELELVIRMSYYFTCST